jgi:hypothetical protein
MRVVRYHRAIKVEPAGPDSLMAIKTLDKKVPMTPERK